MLSIELQVRTDIIHHYILPKINFTIENFHFYYRIVDNGTLLHEGEVKSFQGIVRWIHHNKLADNTFLVLDFFKEKYEKLTSKKKLPLKLVVDPSITVLSKDFVRIYQL